MFTWKGDRLDNLKASHWLRNVGSYFVLMMAFGAMVFFGVCDPQSSGVRAPSGTAAVVGGEVVSAAEFKRFYSSTLDRFRNSQADFDPAKFGLSERVMDYMVGERAAFAKAREIGVVASRYEVEKIIMDQADRFKDDKGKFSAELFTTYLRRNGYTEASFIEEQQRAMTLQKLEQFVDETFFISSKAAEFEYRLSETKFDVDYLKFEPKDVEVVVSDDEISKFLDEKGKEEVKKYYDANTREFNTAAEAKARHILVSFDGARNASGEGAKRSKDAAKKRAEDLLAKVSAAGADFAAIASKETDEEAGKTKGGDLGWFKAETMVKEFSDAAFALEPGKLSGVVESPFGFHIIKLDEKKEAKITTLEQATNDIARKLIEKDKKPTVLRELAQQYLNAAKESKALPGNKAQWKSTGEFAATARGIPNLGTDQAVKDAILTLNASKPVYPELVPSGQNFVIVRLKARKDADMSKLDAEKREQMQRSEGFMLARNYFSAMRSDARKQLEDAKRIWINDEYAMFDKERSEAQTE